MNTTSAEGRFISLGLKSKVNRKIVNQLIGNARAVGRAASHRDASTSKYCWSLSRSCTQEEWTDPQNGQTGDKAISWNSHHMGAYLGIKMSATGHISACLLFCPIAACRLSGIMSALAARDRRKVVDCGMAALWHYRPKLPLEVFVASTSTCQVQFKGAEHGSRFGAHCCECWAAGLS